VGLFVHGFEGHRGEVTERVVAPRAVVEGFDVIEDFKFGLGRIEQQVVIESGLDLERAPKRLYFGVVAAGAAATQALDDAMGSQRSHVQLVHVLAALVGVMQQSGRRWAIPQGAAERGQDQRGRHGPGTSPADDPTAPQIKDGHQVQPAVGRPDGRDVGDPDLVGPARGGPLQSLVGGDGPAVPTVGGSRLAPPLQLVLPHQPRTASPAQGLVLVPQVRGDPRCPVGLPAAPMAGRDGLHQHGILPLPGAGLASAPLVVPAGRDLEEPVEQAERMCVLRGRHFGIPRADAGERMPRDSFGSAPVPASRPAAAASRGAPAPAPVRRGAVPARTAPPGASRPARCATGTGRRL
jgi:hypothetical protein